MKTSAIVISHFLAVAATTIAAEDSDTKQSAIIRNLRKVPTSHGAASALAEKNLETDKTNGRSLWGEDRCWGDGTFCDSIEGLPGPGSCENCCNAGSFWPDRMYFACGQMPCWGANTRCLAGTTCNSCCNGYSWVWYWFGDHCN